MNSRYRPVQRMTLNLDEILLTPVQIDLTPQQEIEALQALIADEQENLRAYASNARVVAVSQAKIQLYETEIQQWQAAIYAAEQEAYMRVQRAAQGYPLELLEKRRAEFVRQAKERGVIE